LNTQNQLLINTGREYLNPVSFSNPLTSPHAQHQNNNLSPVFILTNTNREHNIIDTQRNHFLPLERSFGDPQNNVAPVLLNRAQ